MAKPMAKPDEKDTLAGSVAFKASNNRGIAAL